MINGQLPSTTSFNGLPAQRLPNAAQLSHRLPKASLPQQSDRHQHTLYVEAWDVLAIILLHKVHFEEVDTVDVVFEAMDGFI